MRGNEKENSSMPLVTNRMPRARPPITALQPTGPRSGDGTLQMRHCQARHSKPLGRRGALTEPPERQRTGLAFQAAHNTVRTFEKGTVPYKRADVRRRCCSHNAIDLSFRTVLSLGARTTVY